MNPKDEITEIFYANKNAELIESVIIKLLKQKGQPTSVGDFRNEIVRGMEYAIRTTRKKAKDMPLKTHIRLLNEATISWTLNNITVYSDIKGQDNEKPQHSSDNQTLTAPVIIKANVPEEPKPVNLLEHNAKGHLIETHRIPINLIVSSRDREQKDTTTSNSYYVRFPLIKGVISTELKSAQVPKSGYNINSNNNKLHFSDNGVNSLTATLTIGNYTATTLATEIDTQMTAESLANGTTQAYTVTVNASTNKFTIVQAAGTFSLLFDGGSETYGPSGSTRTKLKVGSVADVIGYGPDDFTGALTYTAGNSYNLDGPLGLYLEVSELGNRITSSGEQIKNTFAWIPFDSAYGAITYHSNLSDSMQLKHFSPPKDKIDKLTIRITDEYGNLYNFNGRDHSLEFEFNTVELSN